MNQKIKKYIIISIVLLSLPSIIYFAYYSIFDTSLDILVAPINSTIEIDGKKVSNNSNIRIKSGKRHIKISYPEFSVYEQDINYEKGNQKLYIGLKYAKGDNSKWYADHPADDAQLTKLSSILYTQESKERLKNNPVLNYIPYTDEKNNYRIDVGSSADNTLEVIITANTCDKESKQFYVQQAMEYLKSKKISNMSELKITEKSLCD